jgi:hypothetical protein
VGSLVLADFLVDLVSLEQTALMAHQASAGSQALLGQAGYRALVVQLAQREQAVFQAFLALAGLAEQA